MSGTVAAPATDGGAALKPEMHPAVDWVLGAIRVLTIIDNQVRALRTRMTIDAFRTGVRKGTYFGIGTAPSPDFEIFLYNRFCRAMAELWKRSP